MTARQNYFMAAIHYAASQWPYDENNEKNLSLNQAKRDCYTRYARLAGKIRVPYLCVAGEADELSPLAHTERLLATLQCPKQLVVYQDSRHSVGNVPSANLGPTPAVLIADWMNARLAGKPFASERWFVEASGRVVKTAY